MTDKDIRSGQNMTDILKSWMMLALTFIFVFLYVALIFDWLKPLNDVTVIARLEPIIFVIIGYYFGRLPAQLNEKTLKDEINRQTQKADAAQNAKEHAKQEREALEEKIKNAAIVLRFNSSGILSSAIIENGEKITAKNAVNQQLIETAVKILDS